jgi:hypothetical protein
MLARLAATTFRGLRPPLTFLAEDAYNYRNGEISLPRQIRE